MNKKSPRRIRPSHCSPSPRGAKAITVTQDTSPCGVAEVCDEYFFWPSEIFVWPNENREKKKKTTEKKNGKLQVPIRIFL